ncbi:MAG: glyoxalase/bleomycin resistance/extradiol dioxygenase family protein [Nanoarchaeota archaeon]|nr:glyoxalase/bleomycin resistance/extradiol dioxygenase family protein [Nanoarchaeota archaeon]
MVKQIFVNLAVKDLDKSVNFFTKLGFKFNPQFTDENATCMIVGENIFVMLLVEKFFKSFIPGKDIMNTSKNAEALMGISGESREEIDEMISNVISAGGKEYRETTDYGWMYGRAFEDLDGHIWEIIYVNENQMPQEMKDK